MNQIHLMSMSVNGIKLAIENVHIKSKMALESFNLFIIIIIKRS